MNGLPRKIAPLLIAGALLAACASQTDVRATDGSPVDTPAAASTDTLSAATPLAPQAASQASALLAGGVLQLQVGGNAGVPMDASAVVMNVTVTNPAAAGFVTVWPCGQHAAVGVEFELRRWAERAEPDDHEVG